jgi:hypothetical protein
MDRAYLLNLFLLCLVIHLFENPSQSLVVSPDRDSDLQLGLRWSVSRQLPLKRYEYEAYLESFFLDI